MQCKGTIISAKSPDTPYSQIYPMRFLGKILFSCLLLLVGVLPAFGQFSFDRLSIRGGYSLHNPHAKRFNKLIDDFNNKRYLIETASNMGSLNFMHGMVLGADYQFTDELFIHAIFKHKGQAIKAQYIDPAWYRHFLFRSNTLELGATYVFHQKGRFSQAAGGGVLLGGLGVKTAWTDAENQPKSKNMLGVSSGFVLGLSVNYEARYKLWDYVSLFVRPVLQYSLNSHISHLNDFFNPTVTESGIEYESDLPDKLNNGALNGLGIEGGLLISLPEIKR